MQATNPLWRSRFFWPRSTPIQPSARRSSFSTIPSPAWTIFAATSPPSRSGGFADALCRPLRYPMRKAFCAFCGTRSTRARFVLSLCKPVLRVSLPLRLTISKPKLSPGILRNVCKSRNSWMASRITRTISERACAPYCSRRLHHHVVNDCAHFGNTSPEHGRVFRDLLR